MSETTPAVAVQTPQEIAKRQLQDIEVVQGLFARAHDYIAQAQYPGHMGAQLAEVLNFLKFQHGDFKQRGETLKKQMQSTVDVEAAKAAAQEALGKAATAEKPEAPKA